ncbi:hypothetical protein K2173_020070 [Erythroxylum novogranatense]|uniref:HMA domain-containing protein n=1 Tax=Erythroxylum novogranatense TaxID=1862640 RepID=A0AAV8U857_9ROSI|nr:hypothetical protein K2173_020070 [Erythroxylum novogranatense]
MAVVSSFSTLQSIFCKPNPSKISSPPLAFLTRAAHFQPCVVASPLKHLALLDNWTRESKKSTFYGVRRLKSVEEETQLTEEVAEADQQQEEAEEQTVSVPVSPSDTLTMYFQAEGTMNEAAIPTVTTALKDIEGISDLKVQVLEGIASVEMTKQTTVQATGVASSLVEVIQGSGFKLQTLNLSFQDEEDLVA